MTAYARNHITDALDRAQKAFEASVNPAASDRVEAGGWFVHNLTVAILLENLRRLNSDLADRITNWMLTEDGIFSDGYAGELLHEWRWQAANHLPLDPIGPPSSSQFRDGRAE